MLRGVHFRATGPLQNHNHRLQLQPGVIRQRPSNRGRLCFLRSRFAGWSNAVITYFPFRRTLGGQPADGAFPPETVGLAFAHSTTRYTLLKCGRPDPAGISRIGNGGDTRAMCFGSSDSSRLVPRSYRRHYRSTGAWQMWNS